MSAEVSLACWITAVAAHGWRLFRVAARTPPASLLMRAGLVFVAAPACLLAIILAVFLVRANLSDAFGNSLFSSFFTVELLAMLTCANTVFHGMVDGVAAFHRRVNAAVSIASRSAS